MCITHRFCDFLFLISFLSHEIFVCIVGIHLERLNSSLLHLQFYIVCILEYLGVWNYACLYIDNFNLKCVCVCVFQFVYDLCVCERDLGLFSLAKIKSCACIRLFVKCDFYWVNDDIVLIQLQLF